MSVKWPQVEVKYITSPPKGRVRKNIHNLSDSSGSESASPDHKKRKEDCKDLEEAD